MAAAGVPPLSAELVSLHGATSPVTWAGSVEQEIHSDGGVQPWRLPRADEALYACDGFGGPWASSGGIGPASPEWSAHMLHDMGGMGAGMRVSFVTDSGSIEIKLAVSHVAGQVPMIDCVVDNQLLVTEHSVALVPGPESGAWSNPQTVQFTGLNYYTGSHSTRVVELWLPQRYRTKVLALRISEGASIRAHVDHRPRWITYGSSITHCAGAFSPSRTWPAVCARAANVNLLCLGFGSNCCLDPLVAHFIAKQPADAISLKLGINMLQTHTQRTFIPSALGFILTIREGGLHAKTPIVVCSPIYSQKNEEAQPEWDGSTAGVRGALTVPMIRQALERMVKTLRERGDLQIFYRDGLSIIGPTDATAAFSDEIDVHPNAAGYELLGHRFAAAEFGNGGRLLRDRAAAL